MSIKQKLTDRECLEALRNLVIQSAEIRILKESGFKPFGDIPEKYLNDLNMVKRFITSNISAFKHAEIQIRSNKKIALPVVKMRSEYLKYVGRNLYDDKDIIMSCIPTYNRAIQFASIRLKDDIDVGLETVKYCGKMQNIWVMNVAPIKN